jgi:hypothetical protein
LRGFYVYNGDSIFDHECASFFEEFSGKPNYVSAKMNQRNNFVHFPKGFEKLLVGRLLE